MRSYLDGDEVLERLGHLAALDGEVARVQEVAHPLVMPESGLRQEGRKGRGQLQRRV